MTINHVISNLAVLAVITTVASHNAMGAIRAGNKSRTYADAYNQLNEVSNPRVSTNGNVVPVNNVETTTVTGQSNKVSELPIRVANAGLADRILRGDATAGVTIDDLSRCGMVYPGGEFAWDKPTAGIGRGGAATCVAVVDIRTRETRDGSEIVLARANVASGSSVRCNISEFPETGYTSAISDFVFPADNPPTMDDVIKVLNAEQKQNAGLKIAAGALIGAIGGNIAGKNDVGKDGLLGTDKGKIQGSIIGGLSGAAIAAGGTYGGKVGGDVIMSTGINAAAGGIMGNALASGDSVLRIEDCELEGGRHSTCLWGYVMDSTPITDDKKEYNFYFNTKDGETTYKCHIDSRKCAPVNLVNIRIKGYADKDIHEAAATRYNKIFDDSNITQYQLSTGTNGNLEMVPKGQSSGNSADDSIYVEIVSAGYMGKQYPAMITGVQDSAFGYKSSDWANLRKKLISEGKKPVGRGVNGRQTTDSKSYTIDNFYPIYSSATDGGIVDFGNKARLKATVTGAGVGGALGAFSAYQGAQSDISERWVSASREYLDSLTKVYCITGSRYLSQYNDNAEILEMP